MDAIALLRVSSEFAYEQLLEAISDIDQPQSWATVTPIENQYLNTAGSIVAVVQHIAACKYSAASCAFTDMHIRGRELFERMSRIGSNWEQTKKFLEESQAYWMDSWSTLRSEQLDDMKGTHMNRSLPAWKIIMRSIVHDEYHTGQINLIRSIAQPSTTPPDMHLDEEERAWQATVFW